MGTFRKLRNTPTHPLGTFRHVFHQKSTCGNYKKDSSRIERDESELSSQKSGETPARPSEEGAGSRERDRLRKLEETKHLKTSVEVERVRESGRISQKQRDILWAERIASQPEDFHWKHNKTLQAVASEPEQRTRHYFITLETTLQIFLRFIGT